MYADVDLLLWLTNSLKVGNPSPIHKHVAVPLIRGEDHHCTCILLVTKNEGVQGIYKYFINLLWEYSNPA